MPHNRSITPCVGTPVGPLQLLLTLLLISTPPAWAIDITVDILGDPVPDGCTPGHCSLREAVTLANSLSGPDRILLPATPGLPLQLTIPGDNENANASGDLDVLDDLEIIGTGAATTTLVQLAADRVLQTTMAVEKRLVLRGLTIQGGRADSGGGLMSSSLLTIEDAAFIGNQASSKGGAIRYSGGFSSQLITEPRLVLRRVRFENNTATSQNGSPTGGALHASNSMFELPFILVEDSEFIGNEAKGTGGAIHMSGAPNAHGGIVTILRSSFRDNRAGSTGGAAIEANSSTFELKVEDSLFDNNVTTTIESFAGGAIDLGQVDSAVFERSTFSSNSGPRGGAIYSTSKLDVLDSHFLDNRAALAGGALHVSNTLLVDRTTFQSNAVTTLESEYTGGGAIAFQGLYHADIFRSTFSNNSAFRGGAITMASTTRLRLYSSTIVASAAGLAGRQATAVRIVDDEFPHSLVFDNNIIIGSCTYPSAGRKPNAARGNIESPGSTCRFDLAIGSTQNQLSATSAQIKLGPLADNGGPTTTRLPGVGSIAINQGSELMCLATDQRHYARNDAFCDVGAVEVGAIDNDIFSSGFDSN